SSSIAAASTLISSLSLHDALPISGMDKRVIFAVAGSGKTTLLIRRLREDRRTLILTFTVNNEAHLRAQIIRRFVYIPYGIRVMRSEEHTSELQSRFDLVCRLLLEK